MIKIGFNLNFPRANMDSKKINILLGSMKVKGLLNTLLNVLPCLINVVWATKIAAEEISPTMTGLKP